MLFHSRSERLVARIEFGPLAVLRMLLVIRQVERVMLCVEKGLPHCRDYTHQRTRITAPLAGLGFEGGVLKNVRFDAGFVGVFPDQSHERAAARKDGVGR